MGGGGGQTSEARSTLTLWRTLGRSWPGRGRASTRQHADSRDGTGSARQMARRPRKPRLLSRRQAVGIQGSAELHFGSTSLSCAAAPGCGRAAKAAGPAQKPPGALAVHSASSRGTQARAAWHLVTWADPPPDITAKDSRQIKGCQVRFAQGPDRPVAPVPSAGRKDACGGTPTKAQPWRLSPVFGRGRSAEGFEVRQGKIPRIDRLPLASRALAQHQPPVPAIFKHRSRSLEDVQRLSGRCVLGSPLGGGLQAAGNSMLGVGLDLRERASDYVLQLPLSIELRPTETAAGAPGL